MSTEMTLEDALEQICYEQQVELNAYKKSMESLLSWLEQKHPEIKEQYFTEKKAEAMARFNFD